MKKKLHILLLLLPFLAVIALVLVSVWNVTVQSLGYIPAFGLTTPTLKYYLEVFRNEDFLSSVWVSLRIAIWSALLASVLGVLVCAALIKCGQTSGGFLYAVRLPILVPHAVVAVFIVQISARPVSSPGQGMRWAFWRTIPSSPRFSILPAIWVRFLPTCGKKFPLWPILCWHL